jgi:hypothetical protein
VVVRTDLSWHRSPPAPRARRHHRGQIADHARTSADRRIDGAKHRSVPARIALGPKARAPRQSLTQIDGPACVSA